MTVLHPTLTIHPHKYTPPTHIHAHARHYYHRAAAIAAELRAAQEARRAAFRAHHHHVMVEGEGGDEKSIYHPNQVGVNVCGGV